MEDERLPAKAHEPTSIPVKTNSVREADETGHKLAWDPTKSPTPSVEKSKSVDHASEPAVGVIKNDLILIKVEHNVKDIEDEQYYQGYMSREEAEKMLEKAGDFLVRKTELKGAESLSQLIAYHQKTRTPINAKKYLLQRGIDRPQWELYHEQVHLQTKLGDGEFGEVYKGIFTQGVFKKPEEVAVKTLKNIMSADDRLAFLREANVMRTLKHPHIIRLHGVCAQRNPIMIVMEIASGGSLENQIKNNAVTVVMMRKYCLEVLSGMKYLEKMQIMHRDLATRNVLLTAKGICKISDFGLSLIGQMHKEEKKSRMPVRWMSPETLKDGTYTSKSDVWSYGCLMLEVFGRGILPYANIEDARAVRRAVVKGNARPSVPRETPPLDQKIMELCWIVNVAQRPTFRELEKEYKPESGVFGALKRAMFRRRERKANSRNGEETLSTCIGDDPSMSKTTTRRRKN